jgi:nickel-type superoxide dismutase maturation protease
LLNAGFPPSRGRLAGLAGSARLEVMVAAAVAAGVAVILRRVRRVIVEGSSMEPILAPGDRLVVAPVLRLRPGDIVAVPDPRHPRRLLVKRVLSVDHHRRLVAVAGDNRDHSTDSRTFGPLPRGAVVGRVVYRYAPAARAGPVEGRR